MILEMKVPSPGESITEVEIAQWLVKDGDYVEKDQAVAEVDSDKATLELPAEVSGTIILKAEEGDAVNVGEVVCTIDTEGKPAKGIIKPKTEIKNLDPIQKEESQIKNYATGTPSPAAKKIISEKNIDISSVVGAYRLKIQDSKISDIHIIYGGLAEKPSRAIKTELSLRQKQWNEDIVCDSAKNIPNDFAPISDHRASANYRLRVASNLLVRLYRDITGEEDASGVVKIS